MRNVEVRIIRFKRATNEPEHTYALNDNGTPVMGCYYYDRSLGRFAAVQRILTKSQLETKCPIIEACDNIDYELPQLPASLVKGFKEAGNGIKNTFLRLP